MKRENGPRVWFKQKHSSKQFFMDSQKTMEGVCSLFSCRNTKEEEFSDMRGITSEYKTSFRKSMNWSQIHWTQEPYTPSSDIQQHYKIDQNLTLRHHSHSPNQRDGVKQRNDLHKMKNVLEINHHVRNTMPPLDIQIKHRLRN